MKIKHNLFIALFGTSVLMGMTACTEDLQTQIRPYGTMKFASDMLATKTADVDLQSTQIVSGVQVGVFVEAGEDVTYANSCLTADGNGSFSSTSVMYWPDASANVYAYAPYNGSWSDALSAEKVFTVALDQSTDEAYLKSDLLWGTPQENPVPQTADVVSVLFAHKLAKLNVNIVNNNESIDLRGASLNVLDVLPSIPVNVKTGDLGAAEGTAADIRIAGFASDAEEFRASALVVPQTVAAGDFLQIVTADSKVLVARLASSLELKSARRYSYTIRISGDSEAVQVELVLDSSISDWEDDSEMGGDASEVVSYVVGDYVLADGTFMKAADAAAAPAEVKAEIAGVIFSTNVSEADAAAGYDGYAMSVWGRKGSQTWCSLAGEEAVLVGNAVSSTSVAFADLDGLSFASLVKAADAEYTYFTAFNFANYSAQKKALTGDNLSGWYVPSLGQMALILNNLAGAEIDLTADYELTGGGEYTDTSHPDIVSRLNACITAVNDASYADFSTSDQFFAAATERDASQIWGVKLTSSGYVIASKASKGNGGRNIAPVFAFKTR